MASKRNPELEAKVLKWIGEIIGEKVPPLQGMSYEDTLNDGVILCKWVYHHLNFVVTEELIAVRYFIKSIHFMPCRAARGQRELDLSIVEHFHLLRKSNWIEFENENSFAQIVPPQFS